MIKIGVMRIFLFVCYILSFIKCNKHLGQFFASSDQEKTLVYLNNTLFIERIDQRTHRHIQYRYNDFSLSSSSQNKQTPVYGIMFDQYSLVSKDMKIYVHKINYGRMTLDHFFTIDLKVLCENQSEKLISFDYTDYCYQSVQDDYITYLHAYLNIIFVSTQKSQFIINIEELLTQIQKQQIQSEKISTIKQEPLLQNLVSFQKFEISDKYCDNCIQGFQFFIKNEQYVILNNSYSVRNQIILPFNLTNQFLTEAENCDEYFDFDMAYEQKGPKIQRGYYIMIRCNQRIKLLKIGKELIDVVENQNLIQNLDKSSNSILLYDYYNQHIYGYFNNSVACFYAIYDNKSKQKFLDEPIENSNETSLVIQNNYHICLNNTNPIMDISHIIYNDQDNKITVVLSKTDEKYTEILGVLIDKCRFFSLKQSIFCNICSQCSNSCATQNLDSCGNSFVNQNYSIYHFKFREKSKQKLFLIFSCQS